MHNVITERVARTTLVLKANDGTVATVRRDDSIRVLGRTPRLRMYLLHIMPTDKAAATVPISRTLLKQVLKSTTITGRVA